MSKVDLHIHSAVSSDGELAPAEIVDMAKANGVALLSITDHNSVRGNKKAQEAANRMGLNFISGIEIDCLFQELNLHVLGYGIDIDDPVFAEIETQVTKQDEETFPRMIQKLQQLGFEITEEAVRKITNATTPAPEHMAESILKDVACLHDLRLAPYRTGGEKNDMPFVHFYYDWCAKGRPAYIEQTHPSLQQVVQIIKNAGGIPVLAHPGASLPTPGTQLPAIIKAGVEGIEVFSSYHSGEQTQVFLEYAQKHDLIMTCGSDFHGKNKPNIQLGSTDCGAFEKQIVGRFCREEERRA